MAIDIDSILPDRNFPDYTVFSRNRNPLYFEFALLFLMDYVANENMVFACQEHFEELIAMNSLLQEEYVEWYHCNNEYYVTQRRNEGQLMDIYILAREKKVLMFFIRKAA